MERVDSGVWGLGCSALALSHHDVCELHLPATAAAGCAGLARWASTLRVRDHKPGSGLKTILHYLGFLVLIIVCVFWGSLL